jgi:hypothetical protein
MDPALDVVLDSGPPSAGSEENVSRIGRIRASRVTFPRVPPLNARRSIASIAPRRSSTRCRVILIRPARMSTGSSFAGVARAAVAADLDRLRTAVLGRDSHLRRALLVVRDGAGAAHEAESGEARCDLSRIPSVEIGPGRIGGPAPEVKRGLSAGMQQDGNTGALGSVMGGPKSFHLY